MSKRGLSASDSSDYARNVLDYVVSQEETTEEPVVPIEEALLSESVYELSSTRESTRVLFITRDTSLLNQTKQSLDGYVDISELFDEVHILILRSGIRAKDPVLRVADNVWVYVASSTYWWWTPVVGYDYVRTELEFADGFRPDLIVARDPFECGLLAYVLGKRFKRPTQLHILRDYAGKEYRKEHPQNRWRLMLSRYVIPRFQSVRTLTNRLQLKLSKEYEFKDLDTLPRLNNFETFAKRTSELDLKERYKPFVFIMLFMGFLSHSSTLPKVLEMAQFVLRNPRVGLVVIGDGPGKREFERRASALNIREQVVFEKKADDLIGYLKSSQILIVTDTTTEADEIAVRGAAAGTPLMLAHTEFRDDVFVDGESALMCLSDDTECFSAKLGIYLNDIDLRREMGKRGQAAVLNELQDDPLAYRQSYRDTIERAILIDEQEEELVEEET